MIYAIDPGKTGAIARLDGRLIEVVDMPEDPVAWLTLYAEPMTLVIEGVGGMPGQGGSRSFNFGFGVGLIHGWARATGTPLVVVTPQRWKGDLRLPRDKAAARALAVESFPEHAASFARVKDDGRAEAALIGLWFLRHGGKA